MIEWHDMILKDMDRYYRLAYCYVKNQQDAKDIIQEALLKALKKEDQLIDKSAVKTWFYRIIVNTSLDFIKLRNKTVYLDDSLWEPAMEEKSFDTMDLKDAVEHLPVKYKTIIVLRYFEDIKICDIAKILNENENTVKSRLYTALKKLKVELEGDDIECIQNKI